MTGISSLANRRGSRFLLPLLALTLLAAAAALLAPPAAVAASWGPCLDCHEDDTLTMTAKNGDEIKLFVQAAELKGSAHRALECAACHRNVNLDTHPEGFTAASAEAYRTGASKACLGCHKAEKLRAQAHHAAVVFEDQQLACVECHGAHGVPAITAWKKTVAPREYCLGCHARALALVGPDGRSVTLTVDAEKLRASVHADHDCDECHEGFTKSAHPVTATGTHGQRAVVAAATCANCHEEKLRQAEGSIHFTLLRSGNDGAPGCSDCHSAHAVAKSERLATLAGTPCRSCHEAIFAAYAGSMHGKARAAEAHVTAPLCSDCHRAHDVKGSADPKLVREACVGCHPEVVALHAAWLPNTALHLDAVSCVACHAPAAERVVALRLVENNTGRQLTEREVGTLLGGTAAGALDPTGDGIDGAELWSALRRLEAGRTASAEKLSVVGRLEVARGVDAHRLAKKAGAIRTCENCHQSGASAFSRTTITLARDDGRPKHFDGSPAVLTDAASLVSVRGFYALGSTRHGLLDWLLVLAVAGGLAVVALHLTFRLRAGQAPKEG